MEKAKSGNETISGTKTTQVRCAFCAQWATSTCQHRKPGRVVHLKDYCNKPICRKHLRMEGIKPLCPEHSPKDKKKSPQDHHSFDKFWNNLYSKRNL